MSKNSFARLVAILLFALSAYAVQRDLSGRVYFTRASTLEVHVVDADGNSAQYMDVSLRPSTSGLWDAEGLREFGSPSQKLSWETTDELGVARLYDFPSGLWRASAGGRYGWAKSYSEPVRAGETASIALTRLPADFTSEFKVVDAMGQPAEDVRARFYWMDRGKRRSSYPSGRKGEFSFIVDQPGVRGVLHVTSPKGRFNSILVDPFVAGSKEVVVQVQGFRPLLIEARARGGELIPEARALFEWEILDERVRDDARTFRGAGDPLVWEQPPVPFFVNVSSGGFHSVALGPLQKADLTSTEGGGAKLVVEMEKAAVFHTRIMHKGKPVEGALLTARKVVESDHGDLGGPRLGMSGYSVRSDSEGRVSFRTPYGVDGDAGDTFQVAAWDEELGGGYSPVFTVEDPRLEQEFTLELTLAPGAIQGGVTLPAGVSPTEVLLRTSGHSGYIALDANGSFLMPNHPPGPAVITVIGSSFSAVSTTYTAPKPGDPYIHMSHGPSQAPGWLFASPTYAVDVPAGGTASIELDLSAQPTCHLEGRLTMNGKKAPIAEVLPMMWGRPGPTVWLVNLEGAPSGLGTDRQSDGSFRLHAVKAGDYVLHIQLQMAFERQWLITQPVTLKEGTLQWDCDIPTGQLLLLPKMTDGVLDAYDGPLHWEGPDGLVIDVNHGENSIQTRETFYFAVPAGVVQLTGAVRSGEPAEAVVTESEINTVETP